MRSSIGVVGARRLAAVVGVGIAMTLAACGGSSGTSSSGTSSGSSSGASTSTAANSNGSGSSSGSSSSSVPKPTTPKPKSSKIATYQLPAQPLPGVESSITVGINNPNVYTEMEVLVAKDKGYFKQVGIDNVKTTTSDSFVAGTVGGSFDITHGDTDQFLNAAFKSHGDVTLVGVYRDKEYHILGVAKGINSVQDLVGKNASAGQIDGRNQFVLETILHKLGLQDASKVHFVPLGGGSDARLQAILSGKLQGAILLPRHKEALYAAGGKFLYNKRVPVPQEAIAANTAFLKKSPNTVSAYMMATLKARQYIEDATPAQKAEIVDMVRKAGYEFPDQFIKLWNTASGQKNLSDGFEPARMTKLVKEEQQLKLIPEGLKWKPLFDFAPLWKAQKAMGIPQSPTPAQLAKVG